LRYNANFNIGKRKNKEKTIYSESEALIIDEYFSTFFYISKWQ